MMGLAAIEYTLTHVNRANDRYLRIKLCEWKVASFLDFYIVSHLYQIFNIIPYNTILGVGCEFLDMSSNFLWTFGDTFIMVISYAISIRFKQFSDRLKNVQEEVQ